MILTYRTLSKNCCRDHSFIFTFFTFTLKISSRFYCTRKKKLSQNKCTIQTTIVSLQTCYSFKIYNHRIFEYFSFEITFSKCFQILNFFHIQNVCCLNETRMENINVNKQIHNILSNKFNVLFCYHQHGILMFFEKIILLLIITNHGVEFICATNFCKNITKCFLKNNNSNCNWILVVTNIYDHNML